MTLKRCPVCKVKPILSKVSKPYTLCGDTLYTYFCCNCHSFDIGMWSSFQKAGKVWNDHVSCFENTK